VAGFASPTTVASSPPPRRGASSLTGRVVCGAGPAQGEPGGFAGAEPIELLHPAHQEGEFLLGTAGGGGGPGGAQLGEVGIESVALGEESQEVQALVRALQGS
jgi:hypothetical protein